jgi:hypothetical protein
MSWWSVPILAQFHPSFSFQAGKEAQAALLAGEGEKRLVPLSLFETMPNGCASFHSTNELVGPDGFITP